MALTGSGGGKGRHADTRPREQAAVRGGGGVGKECGDTSWRKTKVLKYGSGVGSDNLVCVRCFHSWKEGESFLSHPPMIEMNSQWCEFPSSSNLVSN